jgi:competence protein ComEC
LWLWLPLAAASAFFIFYPKKSAAFRAAALLFSAVACFAVQDGLRALDRSFRVTFLDVGQGDAIHLRFPDGTNWLVDAGKGSAPDMGRAVLIPYFRHEGVRRLDSVVITHPQEDHLGGLESLLEEMPVGEYVDPGAPYVSGRYRKLLADLKARRVPRVAVKAGEEARFEGGIRTTVLSAGMPPDAKNINDASIVLKIDHPAGTLVLTGDAGEAAFARINASAPKIHADLLKVPHHGAKPGPEARAFLAASAPSAAVISVGERNRYGHPSAEALAALKAVPGSRVYRTDRSGAVRALFGPGGIRILDGPEAFA